MRATFLTHVLTHMIARDCAKSREITKVTKGELQNYARLRAIIEDREKLRQENWSTPTPKVEGSNPFGHAKIKQTPRGSVLFWSVFREDSKPRQESAAVSACLAPAELILILNIHAN